MTGILIVCLVLASLLHAEGKTKEPQLQRAYAVAQEIRVQGTIGDIQVIGTGRAACTHILIQTPTGLADAHLGYARVADPQFLGLAIGKTVEIVGMPTHDDHGLLLARILMTPSRIFILRNERGIPKLKF